MQIEFVVPGAELNETDALALAVFEPGQLSEPAQEADTASSGQIARAIRASRFTGAAGQTLAVVAPAGSGAGRLVLVGLGKSEAVDTAAAEAAAAHAFNAVKDTSATRLVIAVRGPPVFAAHAALGVSLAAYRFDRYRTTESADKKPSITTVVIETGDPGAAREAHAPLAALAEAIAFARDLVSEPANVLYPVEYARRVRELARLGLEIEVLGVEEMSQLGMGALIGVGQGSARESQLVVIQWKGASDPEAQPIAFVGKGVCFDSGGISIKPAEGMESMIWDMAGSAAVVGAMHVLAARKAKVNAVGILGLVENMPDGAAQRPGDIVKSMSGQTVEVINTDAEGRLVLADALWYCQDRFKPRFMIDFATLTGAIVVALGNDIAGLFCNDETLAANLLAASKSSGDPLWRMPLPAKYEKQLESHAADVKNTGGRAGGSITAALFIQKFVNGLPWAHIDMASTAWKTGSTVPTIPSGATGFGVRLLDRLAAEFYEA